MTYRDLPLLTDHEHVVQMIMDDFTRRTGANIHEGHPAAALMQAIGRKIADNRIILVDETRDMMAQFGELLGVHRRQATRSSGTTRWTATAEPVLVPAGTLIRSDDEWDWTTETTATVTGDGTDIPVTAVLPGPLPGEQVGRVAMVQPAVGIATITFTTVAPGFDAEPLGQYLDRIVRELQVMSLVPRLTHEYAQVALRDRRVTQAHAIAGWNPKTGETGLDRHVGIVVVGQSNQPLGAEACREIASMLTDAAHRPANMLITVADAARIPVAIAWSGVAGVGVGREQAIQAGNTAIETLFAAGRWVFDGTQTIRLNDVIGALWSCPEIEHVTTVTLNETSADVAIDQIGAIPQLAITGQVTP